MSTSLTPSPGDLSIKLMDTILGHGWNNLLHGALGAHLTLLGQLFGVFNAVIMSGLVALFATVTTSGVISTAHSGSVLGKKMSSAWVPIRAIGSIGLLSPLPFAKGLCLMQALVLLFTSYGIGLADHLWTPAVQYLAVQGGTVEGPRPTAAWGAADGILRALVARDYFYSRDPQHTPIGSVTLTYHPGTAGIAPVNYFGGADVPATQAYYQAVIPGPTNTNFGDFATITVKCAGPQVDSLCHAKAAALTGVIERLAPVAVGIVSHYHGGQNIPPPAPSAITALLNWYTQTVSGAIPPYLAQTQAQLVQQQHQFAQQAESEGWASAGDWYESIAGANDLVHRLVSIEPVVSVAPKHALLANVPNTEQTRLPAYLANAEHLMRAADPGMDVQYDERLNSKAANAGNNGVVNLVAREWNRHIGMPLVNGLISAVSDPSGDPLARLQAVGNGIDDAVGGLWTGLSMVRALPGVEFKLPTQLHIAALALLAAGADLAIYLPAIPFVLWLLAIAGWVVLVLESLVAAPLWAAAHGMPEGEGFAGQTGKQGYMLFLSVLLRPALMTIGFFISVGVFDGMSWLVSEGWRVYAAGENAGTILGPVNLAATVAVLVVLLTLLAHQAFGLITWLPAHVTKWIGQAGENLGGEGAGDVRQGAKSAGGALATAGKNAHTPGQGPAQGGKAGAADSGPGLEPSPAQSVPSTNVEK